jgi:signal-transduction protein with cAMP-binding, CBS, and nucleotidyltransferase domain
MECPYCTYDNLEGVDLCACCGGDLTDPVALEDKRSRMEKDLLTTRLEELAVGAHIEVPGELPVREVVRRLNDGGCHCAIVVAEGAVAGIVTERDLVMKLADRLPDVLADPVSQYMTPDPATLRCTDPVVFALNRMMVGGFRHIPLLRDGTLGGVVSVRDVLKYLVSRLDAPAAASAS